MPSLRTVFPFALLGAVLLTQAASAAAEVNVYSLRQPFLIEPIFDAFTRETGIEVNTVFAKEGLVERLVNEGRNSPADLLLTSDGAVLQQAVDAEIVQPVRSAVLEANIPATDRDPEGRWFGLTNRARLIVTSKERVEDGFVSSYADLADPKLAGMLCTRSGKHPYMVALLSLIHI